MQKLLFVLPVLIPLLGVGQIIDNYRGQLFLGDCMFNAQFIRENRIASIRGEFSKKEEMRPIENLGTMELFTFSTQGKPTEYLRSFRMRGGEIDTTSQSYQYNDLSELIQSTKHTIGGYDAIQFEYDNTGNPIREKSLRGEWQNSGKNRETVIKTEASTYEVLFDTLHIRTYLNAEGKPYRIRETVYNRHGMKFSEELRYVLTNKKDLSHYIYDDFGRLSKIIHSSNVAGNQTTTYTMEYDALGNLDRAKVYVNGKLKEAQEFIYEPATLLLNARLVKDEAKGIIYITKYAYEYR
jgi:hypothetical protein